MMNKFIKIFDKRKVLIPYITAGYPDLEITKELIKILDKNGADIIEIGFPFSDPLADGPVIQQASNHSLEHGTRLQDIISLLEEMKGAINCPVLLMGYYNIILQYGRDNFIEDIARAGISGVIIPDLPYDQDSDFYQRLKTNGLAGILLVTPVTTEERMRGIARAASGFVYCVSLLGVTGASKGPAKGLKEYLAMVHNYFTIPAVVGFGIDGPAKAEMVKEVADGVVIGSSLIKIIREESDRDKMLNQVNEFIRSIRSVLDN